MEGFRRVLLRGPVEDAFLYRSTLLCWTYSGELLEYPVRALEAALDRQFGESGRAASYLLFHSRGLGASAEQRDAWWRFLDDQEGSHDGRTISLDLSEIEHHEHRMRVEADDVLDMLAYADRLYLATDGGLYSADLEWSDDSPQWQADLRLDSPTYATAASYGTVAASCGDAGLRMLFDDFGWSGQRTARHMEKVSDYSERVEYASGRLLNYLGRSELEIFEGDLADARSGDSPSDQEVMIGVSESHRGSDRLLADFEAERVEFVASWLSRLVVLGDGHAMSRTLRRHDERLAVLGGVKQLGRYEGRPLDAVPVRDRLLVETSEEVLVLGPSESHEGEGFERISTGPLVSLRAFPRSKRYREMALATTEEGLSLFGFPRTSDLSEHD